MSGLGHPLSDSNPNHSRHAHTHGGVDPSVLSADRSIWAIKWSFVGLFATGIFQTIVVLLSEGNWQRRAHCGWLPRSHRRAS
jgi:hypothetical protein